MGDEHSQSKLPPTNTPIPHPPPQTTYTGLEMTPLRNIFFGHFLLRLSRNKYSQVLSMGKFSPTAPDFGYDFWVKMDLLRSLERLWTEPGLKGNSAVAKECSKHKGAPPHVMLKLTQNQYIWHIYPTVLACTQQSTVGTQRAWSSGSSGRVQIKMVSRAPPPPILLKLIQNQRDWPCKPGVLVCT